MGRDREIAATSEGRADGARLVAYVVCRDGDRPSADELRRHLAERLPEYMVPQAFVFLDGLPLTSNGKLDRKSLPAPTMQSGPCEPPHTPTEAGVAAVWADVLGAPAAVNDDFFASGGDSLLATKLLLRLEAAFGVEIPLRRVFEAPTIAGLARTVEGASRRRTEAPVVRVPRPGPFPLSSAQQRLWFHDRFEPGSTTYNVQKAVRLVGDLDPAVLERAIALIVGRHEILHTTFREIDGQPAQVIVPPEAVGLPLSDLGACPPEQRDTEVGRIIAGELARPFDLVTGPLLRGRLLRLAPREHVLVLTLHHLVCDGWSNAIFVEEVVALYRAGVRGEPSPLPEPPLHYADYAVWEQDRVRSGAFDPHLAYWRRQLGGLLPVLALPVDHRGVVPTRANGASHAFLLGPEIAAGVRELCRQHDVTPFMALMAAWQLLLHWCSGQHDILVGTPTANRDQPELGGIVGFFVNTLVLRADFSGNPTLAEVLRRGRETALHAYTHQALPFDKLIEELRAGGLELPSPMFRAWFALQNVPMPALDLGGLVASPVETWALTAVHDLKLTVVERPSGLACLLDYRTHLFEAGTIRRLAALYAFVVRQLIDVPGTELRSIVDALGREERRFAEAEELQQRAELARGLQSVRRRAMPVGPSGRAP